MMILADKTVIFLLFVALEDLVILGGNKIKNLCNEVGTGQHDELKYINNITMLHFQCVPLMTTYFEMTVHISSCKMNTT